MLKYTILALFFLCNFQSSGQTSKLLTVPQMQQDLDFAYRKLNENHINPYLYVSKDALERCYQKIRKELTHPFTRLQFYVTVSTLVTALRDGHTIIDPPFSDYDAYAKQGLVFPLSVMMNEDGIFVTNNALSDSPVQKGDEIIAINGRTATDLVGDFRSLINDVGPLYDVYARLFNQLYWFKYGAEKTFKIQFKHGNGLIKTVVLPGISRELQKATTQTSDEDFTFRELDNTTGLLTFSRMFKTKEFDNFLDSTFKQIKMHHIDKLIIDIRMNGGGRGKMADSLFNYLTDHPYLQYTGIKYKITQDLKNLYLSHDPNHTDPVDSAFIMSQPNGIVADYLKFNHLEGIIIKPHEKANLFKGRIVLLTSNHTFSGGAIIAGVFKCSGLGVIIGTEPAQSTKFVADHTYVSLPNSKLDLGISFVELHLPCEQSYYHGIRPDYEIKSRPADIKKGIDTQLEFALKVLHEKSIELK